MMHGNPRTNISTKNRGCQRDMWLAFAKAFMLALQVEVGNEPDLQTLAV